MRNNENVPETEQPGHLQALAHTACTQRAQVVQKRHSAKGIAKHLDKL